MDVLIVEEGEHFVLLLHSSDDDEYIFQKVKIQTGLQNGDYMEIFPDDAVTSSSVVLLKGVYNEM